MKPKVCYESVAVLTGCIIGAGILGIPFVVAKVGFWTGLLVIVGLGFLTWLLNIMLGEVSLRSPGVSHLGGYALRYLGRVGKFLMMFSLMVSVYGALVAYTIGVGSSLSAVFGGSWFVWGFVFYACMAFVLWFGLKGLLDSETFMEVFKLLIFGVILFALFSSSHFDSSNLSGFSWNVFLPFGVVLFAYIGMAAIPEVRDALRRCSHNMWWVICWGSFIPMLVYVLFTIAVLGVSGANTTPIASIGIAPLLSPTLFLLVHVFAILAMASSFLALGFALRVMFERDAKLSHGFSWFLMLVIPVLFLFAGVESFTETLDIAGTIAGGLIGSLIVCMHWRAKSLGSRTPEFSVNVPFIGYFVIVAVFVVATVYVVFT